MTREDRCTYIEKMTDSDRADFEKASDYVCALCTKEGMECENCGLADLISDVNFEFEVARK